MRYTYLSLFALLLAVAIGQPVQAAETTPDSAAPATGFTLWQLPNQTATQMMSYVIKTPQGKLIVVDGGNSGDAPYLATFLEQHGNTVSAWFLSHPHSDHISALGELLKEPGALTIDHIYGSLLDTEWMAAHASEGEQKVYTWFTDILHDSKREVEDLSMGQTMTIDGVLIEILGVKNPEILPNGINNSSIIFRVSDNLKSILFTGDLGPQGGEKALQGPMRDRLHATHVQMSHHGQNGTNEAFYQHVGARFCLWPTPLWLWDNDNGGGKGSGPWKTLEVRAWMDKLPIEKHFVMTEGLLTIE